MSRSDKIGITIEGITRAEVAESHLLAHDETLEKTLGKDFELGEGDSNGIESLAILVALVIDVTVKEDGSVNSAP